MIKRLRMAASNLVVAEKRVEYFSDAAAAGDKHTYDIQIEGFKYLFYKFN